MDLEEIEAKLEQVRKERSELEQSWVEFNNLADDIVNKMDERLLAILKRNKNFCLLGSIYGILLLLLGCLDFMAGKEFLGISFIIFSILMLILNILNFVEVNKAYKKHIVKMENETKKV